MKIKLVLLSALFIVQNFVSQAQPSFNINLNVGERNATVNSVDIGDQRIFLDRKGNIRVEHFNKIDLDYYDRFAGDNAGRLKSINGLIIKYYDRFDRDELRGKVKSIDHVAFTYYDVFDDDLLRGKLKSINGIPIKYYDKFGRDELVGKLKSLGNITVNYYDIFDEDIKMGRVKSVKGKTPNVSVTTSSGLLTDVN